MDGPETWRRSLYVFRMRSVPLPLLEAFDQPDAARSCPTRSRTTVPTQALTLLNNPFVVDQSRRLADRVAREAGADRSARVVLAFRLATGRGPSPSQLKALLDYLAGPGDLAGLCLMLFNSNAFLYSIEWSAARRADGSRPGCTPDLSRCSAFRPQRS